MEGGSAAGHQGVESGPGGGGRGMTSYRMFCPLPPQADHFLENRPVDPGTTVAINAKHQGMSSMSSQSSIVIGRLFATPEENDLPCKTVRCPPGALSPRYYRSARGNHRPTSFMRT